MPRKPKTIVLDSWAIMSYLQGEPSAEKVADIIADAHDDHVGHHLRQRYHRLRSRAVGPSLDHVRYVTRGRYAGKATADDDGLRLL